MFGNFWNKKEKPFAGLAGYGGGATGLRAAGLGQSPITASGGTKITDGDYTFHVWGSNAPASQAFTVSDGGPWNIDFLMVGGGGGGGGRGGGGGGAGALIIKTEWEIAGASVGTYPITRGAGGTNPGSVPASGNDGADSIFGAGTPTPLVAAGGGGGAGDPGSAGEAGGSGGGGSKNGYAGGSATATGGAPPAPRATADSPDSGYGSDGAAGDSNGGGAGGGSGVRLNDHQQSPLGVSTIPWLPSTLPGAGTYGYACAIDSGRSCPPQPNPYKGNTYRQGSVYFGAGGAGGGYDTSNGAGFDGGGGDGRGEGGDGYDYSGGGGGGGNGGGEGGGNQENGGNGGCGCIIIRYLTSG